MKNCKLPYINTDMTMYNRPIEKAIEALRRGKVVAYPTESVYGFGCDPFNQNAVTRILAIKNRPIKKGFILIASEWKQVETLVQTLDHKILARVFRTWPGPVTWIFPASATVPCWLQGDHATTIAIRITAHPLARLLCLHFRGPIVSTSANVEKQPPIRDPKILRTTFGNTIDIILEAALGSSRRPTEIRDAITAQVLRTS